MQDSTVGTARQFVELSKALKAAGEGKGKDSLRGQMLAELRAIAQPIVNDARRSVLALDSSAKGRGGAGDAQRAARALRGRKNQGEAAVSRALGRSGLRQAVARSLRIVVKDSGYSQQVGVRVTTDGSRLPAGQSYLPRGLDSDKGWRHPVYGGSGWVTQYGNPAGWFRSTTKAHHPMAIRRVDAVLRKYMDRIATDVNKAA